MSKIVQYVSVSPHGLLKTSDNSNVASTPGSAFKTDDGRSFKYVQAGAVDLATGVVVQSPAAIANHQGLTGTTQAVGDLTITVTLGATLATVNQYAQGFLEVSTGTGAGQRLKIATNAAAALSATCVITLEDAFVLATDGTSRFNLVLNEYTNVVVNPTTQTGSILGVTLCPIPAGNFGYIQTGGVATVLFDDDGTTAIGNSVSFSDSTAGAVSVSTTTLAVIGFTVEEVSASQYGSVYLQL